MEGRERRGGAHRAGGGCCARCADEAGHRPRTLASVDGGGRTGQQAWRGGGWGRGGGRGSPEGGAGSPEGGGGEMGSRESERISDCVVNEAMGSIEPERIPA